MTQYTLRSVTPTVQGSETLGNMTVIMRERLRMQSGELVRVPIITGDAMRNKLRKEVGDLLLSHVLNEGERLPVNAVRFVYAGGVLAGKQSPHTVKDWVQYTEVWPMLGLFGGCCNGRMWPGTLKVSDAVLLCKETAYLADDQAQGEDLLTHRSYVEEAQRVRMDPIQSPAHEGIVVAPSADDEMTMMPRTYEQVVRGSLWLWDVHVTQDVQIQRDLLTAAMYPLVAGKFQVGSRGGTGKGVLRLVSPDPTLQEALAARDRVRTYMEERAAEALKFLSEVDA